MRIPFCVPATGKEEAEAAAKVGLTLGKKVGKIKVCQRLFTSVKSAGKSGWSTYPTIASIVPLSVQTTPDLRKGALLTTRVLGAWSSKQMQRNERLPKRAEDFGRDLATVRLYLRKSVRRLWDTLFLSQPNKKLERIFLLSTAKTIRVGRAMVLVTTVFILGYIKSLVKPLFVVTADRLKEFNGQTLAVNIRGI